MLKYVAMVLAMAIANVLRRRQQTRFNVIRDRQSLLYSPSAMHSVTYLQGASGVDIRQLCGKLAKLIESSGGKLIYVGKVIGTAVQSAQLPEVDWDALLLVQHTSRKAAVSFFRAPQTCDLLKETTRSYTLLMQRSLAVGVVAPIALALCKLAKAILGPFGAPFTPVEKMHPEWEEKFGKFEERIARVGTAADDAIVICNFLKAHADPAIRKKNNIYGLKMMRMLGEVDAGIQHFGSAALLDGQLPEVNDPWQNVALVYYPGKSFLVQLMKSTFWKNVGKDKKEGDTLAVMTCPLNLGL